ncbi:hypothetical protein SLS62_008111 [Diatrype stigma]|uniref:lytic cellulose monooxygenase (C4-dehydrogenating) n=1 Tax=Diatrype stigma TaxID=117547 RepID=A0AAN9YPS0_9PEZI
MRSSSVVLGVSASLLRSVTAHGFVSGVRVNNGSWYNGWNPSWVRFPEADQPERVGWTAANQDIGYIEPANYGTSNISCHKNAKVAEHFVEANAGDELMFIWSETWPPTHKGPIMNYIAPFDTDPASLSFSKFSQSSIVNASGLVTWVTDELIANNYSTSVTIPKNLKAGDYVIRHELIALHYAAQDNGAQNYPQCINLRLGGSGTVAPSEGTLGSELYHRDDAGILFDLSKHEVTYPYPGPELWTAAN